MLYSNCNIEISYSVVALYSLTAIIYLFYPLSGFLADVCVGRLKTVFVSLTSFTCSVIVCLLSKLLSSLYTGIIFQSILFSFRCLCIFIAVISIAGYKANSIQFGLDQLLEAPSQNQALFVHWAKWCYDFMSVLIIAVIAFIFCKFDIDDTFEFKNLTASPLVMLTVMLFFLFLLLILLIIGCIKRHWFYSETRHQNPYRIVIKVLNFAWIHKYPLQRSAFTYCDDERPSRFDYAKESYGGPFTTEQVEDVKTFLKIMIILLAVGPVSILDVVTSDAIFSLIGLHIGSEDLFCNFSWIAVNSGLLRYIVSAIFLPVYMWIIFSLLRN